MKKRKFVWFYRIYFVVGLPLFWLVLAKGSELMHKEFPRQFTTSLTWHLMLWLVLMPIFWIGGSVYAFKFKYSTLGPEKRRAAPSRQFAVLSAKGYACGFLNPTKITLFREGVHLRASYIWHIFIPWNEIEIGECGKICLHTCITIHHSSYELRRRKIVLYIRGIRKDFVLKMHELKNAAAEEK